MESSSFTVETYLYDTLKVQSEKDDPRTAILLHFPSEVSIKEMLLRAGHFVAFYKASQELLNEGQDEMGAIETSNGFCCIMPLYQSRYLVIVHVYSAQTTNKHTSLLRNSFDSDPDTTRLVQKCEEHATAIIDQLGKCFSLLLSCDNFWDGEDTGESLQQIVGAYFDTWDENKLRSRMLEYVPYSQPAGKVFRQVSALFQNLIQDQWIIYDDGTLHKYGKTPIEDVLWMSFLTKVKMRLGKTCHGIDKDNFNVSSSVKIFPLMSTSETGLLETSSQSPFQLADVIRNRMLALSYMDLSSKCRSIYIYKSQSFHYFILLKSCQDLLTPTFLNVLWSATVGKLALLEDNRMSAGDSSSSNSSFLSRRKSNKNKMTVYYFCCSYSGILSCFLAGLASFLEASIFKSMQILFLVSIGLMISST